MRRHMIPRVCLSLCLTGLSTAALAQGRDCAQLRNNPAILQDRMLSYDRELMTAQERAELRAAKTQQQHDQIQAEHQKAIQERAKECGIALPDTSPPASRSPGKNP